MTEIMTYLDLNRSISNGCCNLDGSISNRYWNIDGLSSNANFLKKRNQKALSDLHSSIRLQHQLKNKYGYDLKQLLWEIDHEIDCKIAQRDCFEELYGLFPFDLHTLLDRSLNFGRPLPIYSYDPPTDQDYERLRQSEALLSESLDRLGYLSRISHLSESGDFIDEGIQEEFEETEEEEKFEETEEEPNNVKDEEKETDKVQDENKVKEEEIIEIVESSGTFDPFPCDPVEFIKINSKNNNDENNENSIIDIISVPSNTPKPPPIPTKPSTRSHQIKRLSKITSSRRSFKMTYFPKRKINKRK